MTRPVVPLLVSFAYGEKWDLGAEQAYAAERGLDLRIMADSGAFTAHTTGKPVNMASYVAWLHRWGPAIFSCAATLDVIGDWQATAINTRRLRDLAGDAINVLGIYHCGSPLDALTRQCTEGSYVAIGGAVGNTGRRQAMMQLLARAHRVARDRGVVLHGLGLTVPEFVLTFPWMSVDSAYWSSARRTGTLMLFDAPTGKFGKFRVSTKKVFDHARLIQQYGMTAARAALPGFGIVGARGAEGREEALWLTDASMLSWLRFGARWKAGHKPVATPPGATVLGPTLYLAVCSPGEIRRVVDLAAGDPVWRAYASRAPEAVTP